VTPLPAARPSSDRADEPSSRRFHRVGPRPGMPATPPERSGTDHPGSPDPTGLWAGGVWAGVGPGVRRGGRVPRQSPDAHLRRGLRCYPGCCCAVPPA